MQADEVDVHFGLWILSQYVGFRGFVCKREPAQLSALTDRSVINLKALYELVRMPARTNNVLY